MHLDLDFDKRFGSERVGAYERLLLDVLDGRLNLFVRSDEQEEAWRWVEPLLNHWRGNRNGLREADEPLLQQRTASPRGVQILGRSNLSQSMAYGAHGGSEGVYGQFLAGTLDLCAAGQAEGWQVVLSSLGRARLAKVAVASCP